MELDCMYSCNLCGLKKIHVKVPVREEGQDVKQWATDVLTSKLAEDHGRRSPDCHPTTLSEVYIPISGAKMVGGPSSQ